MNNNMYNMNNNQQYGQMNDIPDNIYNMPQQQLSKPLNGKNNIIMYAVGGVILIAVIFVVIKLLSGGGYTVNCTKTYDDYGSETYKFKFDGEYFKNGKFEMDMDCSKIPGTTPEKCRTANICSTIENSHIRDYKIVNCTSKSSGDKLYVSADIEFIFEEDKAEPQDVEKLRDYFVDGNYTCK